MSQSDSNNLSPGTWNNPNYYNCHVDGLLTVNNLQVNGSSNIPGSSSDTLVEGTFFGALTNGYNYRITSIVVGSVTHVIMHLPQFTDTSQANNYITLSPGVPSELRPLTGSYSSFPILTLDNSAFTNGLLTINGITGNITIFPSVAQGFFQNTLDCGIASDCYVTWDLSSN